MESQWDTLHLLMGSKTSLSLLEGRGISMGRSGGGRAVGRISDDSRPDKMRSVMSNGGGLWAPGNVGGGG